MWIVRVRAVNHAARNWKHDWACNHMLRHKQFLDHSSIPTIITIQRSSEIFGIIAMFNVSTHTLDNFLIFDTDSESKMPLNYRSSIFVTTVFVFFYFVIGFEFSILNNLAAHKCQASNQQAIWIIFANRFEYRIRPLRSSYQHIRSYFECLCERERHIHSKPLGFRIGWRTVTLRRIHSLSHIKATFFRDLFFYVTHIFFFVAWFSFEMDLFLAASRHRIEHS